ncbi:carbon storage regulator [Legionella maceachernii]|uniref:Carbon storage regulator CsrA n=1 Tax=Legionella maceachernii TaxID=466 RepID=A0A0W0VVH2_9GAMM|nr:carbon storage regulator [Legionella maceachernii]KTD23917.1 carbon storage regulator CsrA [Legionella maceachernii]SKA17871.1 carbon storage regulator, CsrA [Legionella maceachernii]SUP04543.1 Uncharacterised protein [Legionella maceachernii]
MDLITINFQEKLILKKDNKKIVIIAYPNKGFSGISIGVDAPQAISVNREEIFKKKIK